MKIILFLSLGITALLFFSGCSPLRQIAHDEIMALETRDERAARKMMIRFDRVIIGLNNDSIQAAGKTMTMDSLPLSGVRIQFGIWRTVDEGTYFIIREEFTSDSAGRFEIRTKILPEEWMVLESEIETRFFDIRSAWE